MTEFEKYNRGDVELERKLHEEFARHDSEMNRINFFHAFCAFVVLAVMILIPTGALYAVINYFFGGK